ncbi:Uncharacterised protein [Mycobacterium tuberculosis]|nr:Uncharacterised protein [Mycobacterium tuberculosis]
MRPTFFGFAMPMSMALEFTAAISPNTEPAEISATPSQNRAGCGSTNHNPSMQRMRAPVPMPSHSFCRPAASARCPSTGASRRMPKAAIVDPSPRPEARSASAATRTGSLGSRAATSGGRNEALTRYSAVKTNVRMTVLNGCVAQSHSAQEYTCFRGAGVSPRRSRPTTATAPLFAVATGSGVPAAGSGEVMLEVWPRTVNAR